MTLLPQRKSQTCGMGTNTVSCGQGREKALGWGMRSDLMAAEHWSWSCLTMLTNRTNDD